MIKQHTFLELMRFIPRLNIIHCTFVLCLCFIACEENETIPSPQIALSHEVLDFDAHGGINTISLTASDEWTVMTDREWCLVSPANGNGSTTCEIRVDSSYLYDTREAHLTFRCGKYSRQLVIQQLGYDRVIKLDKELIEVADFSDYDKMFENVRVTSNIPYTVEVEYADESRTGWLKVKTEELKGGSIPRTSTVRLDYDLYAESDADRVATIVFKQKNSTAEEDTLVESRLTFRQKKAQEIIPSRQGDSLAVLTIARLMRCAYNIDPSTPMIHWNNIETEELEYVNEKGETVDELRVVGLRFSMFDTDRTIPYQIRKLDQLRTLSLTGNTDAAGKNIELEDDITYLPHLKSINLLGYGISKLPARMKEMTQLEELDLSGNNFTSLPIDIITELDKHNLLYINFGNNRVKDVFGRLNENASDKEKLGLHGALPEALFTLKNVVYIGLSYNYFEGSIPDMGYDASQYETEEEKVANNLVMPQLENLAINLNFLTGNIPDWILYHKNLKCWDPYTLVFNQFENGKDSSGKRVGFDNVPSYIKRPCPLWGKDDEDDEE